MRIWNVNITGWASQSENTSDVGQTGINGSWAPPSFI